MRQAIVVSLPLPFLLHACNSDSDSGPAQTPEPLVINHGLAVGLLAGSGDLRLAVVPELGEGRDLTADGDLDDKVLHLLELRTGALTNTGIALATRFPFRDEVPPPQPDCNDALGVFLVDELASGLDLDQDGTPAEVETWTFNRRTGLLASLSAGAAQAVLGGDLAAFVGSDGAGMGFLGLFDARDASVTTIPVQASAVVAVQDGLVAFSRSENGAFDLNADGDTSDFSVLHVLDSRTNRVDNLSFDVSVFDVRIRGGHVGFSVHEGAHGALDLNGDGDAEDSVFVAVDGRTGRMRIPGLQGVSPADFGSQVVTSFLLGAAESDGDRNGDGDRGDLTGVVYEPTTERLHDTGLALGLGAIFPLGRWIGVTVSEESEGESDLDGDGHVGGFVPHVFDTSTGARVNLGFSGLFEAALRDQLLGLRIVQDGAHFRGELFAWSPRAGTTFFPDFAMGAVRGTAGDQALLVLNEGNGDLNDDGDALDLVYAVYDGKTRSVRSLGLAADTQASSLGPLGRAAVLVPELAQGASDLNGDGDTDDLVLHEIVLDPRGR